MAGQGRKEFDDGDVLSAADVNGYLMDQSVMRFADSSARTAAIGTPTEGMVSYLDDTNDVEVFDGTDWVNFTGDITNVTAGTGLTGGGSEGSVTLDVDYSEVVENVITTQGDLIIGDASGDPVRLPVGSADQVLTSDGTTVSFQDAGGGGATEFYTVGEHVVDKPAGFYSLKHNYNFITINGQVSNSDEIKEFNSFTEIKVSPGGLQFSLQKPAFSANILNAVAFGDGTFIVAGQGGDFYKSTDGESWTAVSFPTSDEINAAVYGEAEGIWVLGVSGGDVFTSTDLITFTVRSSTFGTTKIEAAAYGDSTFVIVGGAGKIATSDDGINWTSRSSGIGTQSIAGVAFGDSKFVACNDAGDVTVSSDGSSWSESATPTSESLKAVAFGDGTWVAVGDDGTIVNSADALNWSDNSLSILNNFRVVIYESGMWIVAGTGGDVRVSSDGTSREWLPIQPEDINKTLFGGSYGNKVFVLSGVSQEVQTSKPGYLLLEELPTPITP